MRIVFAILTLAAAATAGGHHSVAMYDNDNLITLGGTVTRVEWTSPHVFLYFETTMDDGSLVEWSVELDPPVLLSRYGWRRTTVQPGEAIEFTGAPAKSGAPAMRGAIAVLGDGTTLRVWSRV
ncbi:MAG TPA: DUF6152 family protein [Gammaproteobacteria bacterium]|nr:DUF6152 family protein [Gammaproteobacteria bacterium]